MSFTCEHCGSTVSCLSQVGRGLGPHALHLEQKPFGWVCQLGSENIHDLWVGPDPHPGWGAHQYPVYAKVAP